MLSRQRDKDGALSARLGTNIAAELLLLLLLVVLPALRQPPSCKAPLNDDETQRAEAASEMGDSNKNQTERINPAKPRLAPTE